MVSFPQVSHQNPVYASLLTIRATCPAHLILLDFITRTILDGEYRSLSFSLCSYAICSYSYNDAQLNRGKSSNLLFSWVLPSSSREKRKTFISVYSKNIHRMSTFHKSEDWSLSHDLLFMFSATKHCTGSWFHALHFGFNGAYKNMRLSCPNYPACQTLLCGYVIFISSNISLAFWLCHISCKYLVNYIILEKVHA